MQALVLTIHILAMSCSLVFSIAALALGFMGKHALLLAAKAALVATLVGTISGAILLAATPIASQCLALTAYLFGFGLLYRFAFGNGSAGACPFLKNQNNL